MQIKQAKAADCSDREEYYEKPSYHQKFSEWLIDLSGR